ncbi:MAG: TRAP transporter small permease [Alphaproteobacteria bacterium]|nr:TRAP transporter small permease [Alphaproteobacteria bacterium]MCY4317668.1 TRAP transporter small permease [Alphaproteobacteria bacterium]
MFERIYIALEWISRRAVWVGGAALLAAAVMVTLDVLSRKFLNVTMSGADEISGYVFAASTTWAYSYCLLHRANIRIDALYNFMPRWLCALLDAVAVLLLLIYNSELARRAWNAFIESWDKDSVSITTLATPQWIPQFFWASGLVFFELVLVFVFLYTLVGLLRHDLDLVRRIAGVPSVAEEIEAETHGMNLRTGTQED